MRSLLLLAFLAVPAAAQGPSGAVVPDIDPTKLIEVARTIKSVRAKPDSVTIRVGQTLQLDAIVVTAIDSSGRVRGRLTGYDFGIPPGAAASAEPRKLTGVRAGVAELTVRYPGSGWRERTDPRPAAKVKVIVKP